METLKEEQEIKKLEKNNQLKESKLNKIYDYFCIFFISSIIGWIYEMIFYKITENILENRGFLYGPYVPVYGIGAVLIVLLLKRFKKNPIFFFILTMLVTGILEYIVGAYMLAIWKRRWWDYTGLFMNIQGHVCLRSVLSFAIGALPLIYLIEPKIIEINKKLTNNKKIYIYGSIFLIMIIDLIICLIIRNPIKF